MTLAVPLEPVKVRVYKNGITYTDKPSDKEAFELRIVHGCRRTQSVFIERGKVLERIEVIMSEEIHE